MAFYGDPAREQALDARDPAIEAMMKRQEEEIHTKYGKPEVFPESPTRSSEPGSASGTANRLPVTLEVIGTPAMPEPPRRRHADPTPKKRGARSPDSSRPARSRRRAPSSPDLRPGEITECKCNPIQRNEPGYFKCERCESV